MSDHHLSGALAQLALDAADAAGSPNTSTAAVRTLVDWFAVAVGGTAAPAAQALRRAFASTRGDVRLIASHRLSSSAETAALIHGTAAHALELDDIYSPGLYHPGAPTIAAALASAESVGASGAALVRGVIAGIEIGCRIAMDLGPHHYRHWHTTGTAGTIGAAVAATVVRDASLEQVAQAIAIAGTMSAGLQQTFRRDGQAKPLHAGHAAQSGVIAGLGAMEGLTGAPDILEGSSGLAVATGVETTWEASRAPLTTQLCIEDLTVKPYPCCGHTFAAIDAIRELRARGVRLHDVIGLTVDTYSAALATAGIPMPGKPSEARFSIPFAVVTALHDEQVTRESFVEERVADPRIVDMLPRVTLRAHPDFDDVFPARRGARVTVTLTDGTAIAADAPDRLGSPENPISSEALNAKFDDLVRPSLGADQATRLLKMISSISSLPTVGDLPVTSNVSEREESRYDQHTHL